MEHSEGAPPEVNDATVQALHLLITCLRRYEGFVWPSEADGIEGVGVALDTFVVLDGSATEGPRTFRADLRMVITPISNSDGPRPGPQGGVYLP